MCLFFLVSFMSHDTLFPSNDTLSFSIHDTLFLKDGTCFPSIRHIIRCFHPMTDNLYNHLCLLYVPPTSVSLHRQPPPQLTQTLSVLHTVLQMAACNDRPITHRPHPGIILPFYGCSIHTRSLGPSARGGN